MLDENSFDLICIATPTDYEASTDSFDTDSIENVSPPYYINPREETENDSTRNA